MTSDPEPDGYRVLDSEPIYDGALLSLRRDTLRMPDGSQAEREVVGHPGAGAVVAPDDDDRVVLVNQYRHPVGRRLDELPAGLLDVDGESAPDAARRELAEEAALRAEHWDVLLDLNPSPGMSDEAIRIYLARGLHDAEDAGFQPEHEEVGMRVERIALDEAVQRALSGRLTNATTVAGILAAARVRAAGWDGLRPVGAPWPDRPDR